MTPDWSRDDHLSPDALAAYVDRTLDANKAAEVEKHLAECADCRSAALSAEREPARRRRTGAALRVDVAPVALRRGDFLTAVVRVGS